VLAIGGWAATFGTLGLAFALVRGVEARHSAEDSSTADARAEMQREWAFALIYLASAALLAPLSVWVCSRGMAAVGGHPFLYFRAQGWVGRLALTLGYFVLMDMIDYAWHRACHSVPWLWAIHSFHHSSTHLTVVTTAREHWTAAALSLPVRTTIGLLIGIDPTTVLFATWIWSIPPRLSHMNVRHPWGANPFVVTPQWHRIHHSTRPEHQGKNFAVVLPFMDVLFGTAYAPQPDEYPATGLASQEQAGFFDALVWPFRRSWRAAFERLRGSPSGTQA
jgi:sterol desaturase/sphingolipid hydroxylase (fatty acid hydroxylase superfamily)